MALSRKTPLKQKKPLQRKTPLRSRKSSPSADIRIEPDKFTTSVPVKRMRSKPNRPTVAEGSKYLAACRGERCYLNVFEVCLHARETVVPCHSNQSRHGKGMGIKAKNEYSVPGCRACHVFIDQGPATREYKFEIWDRAYAEWEPVRARKMNLQPETEAA